VTSRSGEETAGGRPGIFEGPGWSPLLRELAERLRRERRQLEREVHWGVLAQAEREIAQELAQEAARRLREQVRSLRARGAPAEAALEGEHQRFSVLFRAQHIGLFASTLALIVTGLPLRYAETEWAQSFFHWIGGVPVQAAVHRLAAGLLIAVSAFHVYYIGVTKEGQRELRALLPRPKDVLDLFHNLAYFLGWARRGPKFDRFSYIEKFDYWAVYWGVVIMVGSGLVLWMPEVSMRFLPKYLLDIAQAIHSDEALLAASAIIIWHFYNVHFSPEYFPLNWTWFTGRLPIERLRKHHPLEYERLRRAGRGNGRQ